MSDGPLALAARALAGGNPLTALSALGGEPSPEASAIRGVALAQLDELEAASRELRRAVRLLRDPLASARAQAALAEVRVADRNLRGASALLRRAAEKLLALGDWANAGWASVVEARCCGLTGDELGSQRALRRAFTAAPRAGAAVAAALALTRAEQALRQGALAEAMEAAEAAQLVARGVPPALLREVERFAAGLRAPIAELDGTPATLAEVRAAVAGGGLLLDEAYRRVLRRGTVALDLSSRPVLFAILAALWSGGGAPVPADELIRRAFEVRHPNESHRARLRVALSRLRSACRPFAKLVAEARGWRLELSEPARRVAPLGSPSALSSWLVDGAAWSPSALARASGLSLRTVQRTLAELAASGQVIALGRGRARRYALATLRDGIAPSLLLAGW